ncbi:MAG TPA: Ig-like domain-containing protein [Kofleriaceae bacterium]|nr:Ig-like domain-containing protein [Kofleriaceae bacterium]
MKKLALLALLVACGHKAAAPPPAPPEPTKPADTGPPYDAMHVPRGIDIRLTDGKQGPAAADHSKPADARLLTPFETAPLFARMSPLAPAATSAFALQPASQPPPKPGDTIATSFPAPPSAPPAPVETGELHVLRYMPEGAVPIAPQLTITFSQPMVAVTSQSDAASTVPVKLTPQPKGTWRWIGTRTVVFDPDPRFAQATTFHVDVPAGTTSATGGALAKGVSFSFETPTPTLTGYWPDGGPQGLDVPMYAQFDQKIDPTAALAKLALKANGKPLEARLLTQAEIAQLASPLKELIATPTNDGHWIAFRATTTLPTDSAITATFGSGMPSAEGPNKTKQPQEFRFQTYSAFRVSELQCQTACPPDSALGIEFDNSIDESKFDDQLVQVTPEIPNLHVIASGNYLELTGETRPRTKYQVKVGRALTDRFGQTLAKDLALEFHVADAEPAFFAPSGLVVLDPKQPKPELDIYTTNYESIDVQLYRVAPTDWDAYRTYIAQWWNHDHPPPPPGARVADETLRVTHGANRLEETAIDLAAALHDGRGDVVVIAEPTAWKAQPYHRPMIAWVEATKLGLDAHADGTKIIAYASDLATGKPIANAALALLQTTTAATTDATGVATLAVPLNTTGNLLLATAGDDHAFVVSDSGTWGYDTSHRTWYVADDRQLYRPGERVALKGWIRQLGRGDVEPLDAHITEVAYRVIDTQGNELLKGTSKLGALGGFDVEFTLPKTPNLGSTQVQLTAGGETATHYIRVEEFRRPEFEVNAHADAGPYVVADAGADVTVDAKYFAGGPLAGADARWVVSASPTSFTPPNRDDFHFGGYSEALSDDNDKQQKPLPTSWRHDAKTDAMGDSVLHVDVASVRPATPISVVAEATVRDMNNQGSSASATVLVHPSTAYVGLKPHKAFVTQGVPFDVDVIGVGIDGKPLPGTKIALRAVRLDWKYDKGRYRSLELEPQTCDVVASQASAPCHFSTAKPGTYRLVATISDARNRPNYTELTYWVAGGVTGAPTTTVTMIADKPEYAVGETAHVLASPPFYPAEGLVSWRRNGIVQTSRVTFTAPSTVLDVPITEALVPNVWLHVDVAGQAPETGDNGDPDPKLPPRVAIASGDVDLSIPAKTRTLGVTITPAADKVAPGSKTTLAIKVVDASGKPVPNAEVAVLAVDESVLNLTGYKHPNPIDTFYAQRGADVQDFYSRSYVQHHLRPTTDSWRGMYQRAGGGYARRALEDGDYESFDAGTSKSERMAPMVTASPAPPPKPSSAQEMPDPNKNEDKPAEKEPMGGEEAGKTASDSRASGPIAIRTNFDALATFAPSVTTGADGTARVELALPDNLTRYRLVAIAASGAKQFGKGESSLTARLPLMVRASPPRFLNFGDSFRLPIVLQNQTDAAMTVRVAVRASNVAITAGAGREVRVPANDRALVEIPMAAELAGTARLQVVGVAGDASDAAELALPVWTPATTEAFATYGVIDNGAVAQPVALPGHVVPQFGGLEVSTASTNLQSLTDALLYLVHYPFDCAEQRASRIAGIAALRDELAAFHAAELPSDATLAASMADDLDHLANMQNSNGGFSYWDRDERSDPYLSVYVVDALAHARAKGLAVPAALFEKAKPYLANIEEYLPMPYYDLQTRAAIEAYALATRKLLGDVDIAKGQHVIREVGGADKLQIDTAGWLLQVFAGNANAKAERAAIVRFALNRVSETAGAANFTTSYGDAGRVMLASDRRADAVMLEGMIEDQKGSDLIPKIVTGLLGHRSKGHWDNTQEDSFVLVALDHYFRVYEKITPDFVARVWLGSDYAGDHKFAGHTTENHEVDIAMTDVARHDHAPLTIAKDGAGRLYYRIAMTYAPADLKLAAADYGFAVQRRYEPIDDPKDVVRAADGTWHVKAGARVRIHVTMVNDNRRYQVALVDPLPAGLEPLNPELATTGSIPSDPKTNWWGAWYQHQNLRDERAEAFTSLLWEGTHDYTYVARATTPGDFVVPPPKAEEMYAPETFGRGASDHLIVE